jgi:hypothetical protein
MTNKSTYADLIMKLKSLPKDLKHEATIWTAEMLWESGKEKNAIAVLDEYIKNVT